MSPIPYYFCYIVPLSFFLSVYLGGWSFFLTPFVGFILVPFLDLIFGKEETNLSPEQEKEVKDKFSFRIVTLLWVPTQAAVVLTGAWYVSTHEVSFLQFLLIVLSAGMNGGGVGITIAHELCHRQTKLEQWSSQIILAFINYMHFHIEHIVGHHQRVSTPEDPTSAQLGESFYTFYPKTVIGSYKSAWNFEKRRVKRIGMHRNRMLHYLGWQFLLNLAILLVFGPIGFIFHIAQSIASFSFLEVVNYVEHYGLQRKKLPNGRYEKVQPIHSWNANHRVSNLFLFKLQRHSDHHANALRRYQILRNFEEAPQLPLGYPLMIILAMVPPLWRKVMDPRVEAHRRSLVV